MSTTQAPARTTHDDAQDGAPVGAAVPTRMTATHRPPGIRTPLFLWGFMVASWLGMALDTLLGFPVIAQLFPEFPVWGVLLLMVALGLACAALASKAGVDMAYGNHLRAGLMLVCVLGVGAALAYARLSLGFTGGDGSDGFGAAAEDGNSEVPATLLMLVLYVGSTMGAMFTAQKVFIAERAELRRVKAKIDELSAHQAREEAEYAVIHERIARRDDIQADMEMLHRKALEQADARESFLKAFARDAIVRALGRPDAAPLIRAPHEPTLH